MTDTTVIGRLQPGDHVCWTYDADTERDRAEESYVTGGLFAGEKVVCFVDSRDPDAFLSAMPHAHAELAAALDTGQLRVEHATDSYVAGGDFRQARMLELWRSEVETARREGWPSLRAVGEMDWAARPAVGTEQVASYEAEVNQLFAEGYASALCLYDRRLFDEPQLSELACAHPATVWRGAHRRWEPLLRMRRTTTPPGLRLAGEVDLSNRGAFRAVLTGVFDELARGRCVTIDISDLGFVDAAAGNLLARAAGSGAQLRGGTPPVVRVLELLDQRPDRGEANA